MVPPKLIMFDLDGTLAESKSPLDAEMADLLRQLLGKTKVAVISGASFAQFQSQFLHFLGGDALQLANLLILPTVGASFYTYIAAISGAAAVEGSWKIVYENRLSPQEVDRVKESLDTALAQAVKNGIDMDMAKDAPEKIYGERIEDRGAQVTFSALGQKAPAGEKATWDPDHKKRDEIRKNLLPLLPDFEIQIGGMTSIDITKKGIDKEYGIDKATEYLGLSKNDVLYVGDSLFEGGNDYGAIKAGVRTLAVKDVAETKKFIRDYLAAGK